MKCEKCGGKIVNGCCINCGYMINGNYSKMEDTDNFIDIKNYNSSFDEMYRNEKIYLPIILGPLYFSYRNHVLLGILFSTIDLIVSMFVISTLSGVFSFNILGFYMSAIIYIVVRGLFYAVIANPICIRLELFEVKWLKLRNKFEKVIIKRKSKSIMKIIINLLVLVLITLYYIILQGK